MFSKNFERLLERGKPSETQKVALEALERVVLRTRCFAGYTFWGIPNVNALEALRATRSGRLQWRECANLEIWAKEKYETAIDGITYSVLVTIPSVPYAPRGAFPLT
jgi:hypothetical protein